MSANGAVIGASNTPTSALAKGVWGPSYAAERMRDYSWPLVDSKFAYVDLLTRFFSDGLIGQFGSIPVVGAQLKNNTITSSIPNFPLLSNAQAKWGTLSAQITSANQFLANPASTPGTGDFCTECWFWPIALGNAINTLFDFRSAASEASPSLYADAAGALNYYLSGAIKFTTASGSLVVGTWQHVAMARVSGVVRIFVNGVQVASYSDAGSYLSNPRFRLGQSYNGGSEYLSCYVSDFRSTLSQNATATGAGRYSASFTPPTAPFPEVGP